MLENKTVHLMVLTVHIITMVTLAVVGSNIAARSVEVRIRLKYSNIFSGTKSSKMDTIAV